MYSQVYSWCLWTAALVAFVWPWLQQSPSSLPSPCQVLENTHAVTSHYPTAPTVWTEQCVLLQAHTSGVCLALITLVSFLSSMSAIAAVESTHTYTHTHTHTHKSTTLLPPPPYTQSNNNITTESHKNHTLLTACCATLLLREQYERERDSHNSMKWIMDATLPHSVKTAPMLLIMHYTMRAILQLFAYILFLFLLSPPSSCHLLV